MKKFSFNLESVLNHRRMMEDDELQKLMKIQHAIARVEMKKHKIQEEISNNRQTMKLQGAGEVNIQEIRQRHLYLEKLERDSLALGQQTIKLEEEKRMQSERLVQARKKREILEKLKEKGIDSHQRELREVEQKLLDELSTVKFARRYGQDLPVRKSRT